MHPGWSGGSEGAMVSCVFFRSPQNFIWMKLTGMCTLDTIAFAAALHKEIPRGQKFSHYTRLGLWVTEISEADPLQKERMPSFFP